MFLFLASCSAILLLLFVVDRFVLPRPKKTNIIAIEGNIASGKSTLCSRYENRFLHGQRVRVILEDIPQSLLELFYSNPKKYAFALQLNTLQKRLDALWHAKWTRPSNVVLLLDRSTLGDMVFAMKHYLDGNISTQEWNAYLDQAGQTKSKVFLFQEVDCIVYLHTHPLRCRKYVLARGHVDQTVETVYLDDLDHLHVYLILFLLLHVPSIRIHVREWNGFGDSLDHRLHEKGATAAWSESSDAIDLEESLEPMRTDAFSQLPAEYRYVHSQEWKDRIMHKLSIHETLFFRNHRRTKKCLIDWFPQVHLFSP